MTITPGAAEAGQAPPVNTHLKQNETQVSGSVIITSCCLDTPEAIRDKLVNWERTVKTDRMGENQVSRNEREANMLNATVYEHSDNYSLSILKKSIQRK